MRTLQISGLDDQVLLAIQARAQLKGRSLEEEVRDIITRSVLSPADKVEIARRIQAMTIGGPHPGYTLDEIRDGLE
jgi:plasmid stability protein